MKIELSIKTEYLPTWGSFEGIRELIQNGRDAELEFGTPLEVRHQADNNTLVIETTGRTLPHEALLFGYTTKVGKGELIGKFGEGLKLGTLALVRSGYDVKIRSGAEIWTPTIERSEKFDADVLVFNIEKGRKPKDRIQIVVYNISKEEWDTMRACFLFLNKRSKEDKFRIDTSYGALLLDEADRGKVFVKGIFVEHDPELKWGYDLTKDVEIDRDRKMINRYDLKWRMALIWKLSMSERQDLINAYLEMLEKNTADLAGVDEYSASSLPEEVKKQAAAKFTATHGANAVPVESLADSKEVEHLGRKGILTPYKPLKAVLETIFGNTEKIKLDLRNEVVRHYSWSDLTIEERSNLESAIALVNKVEPIALDTIDVVDFRSEDTVGMFKDGRVFLSKNKLSDRDMTLETLIHEVAHFAGSDGSHRHVANIERIWSRIVSELRNHL